MVAAAHKEMEAPANVASVRSLQGIAIHLILPDAQNRQNIRAMLQYKEAIIVLSSMLSLYTNGICSMMRAHHITEQALYLGIFL